MGCLWFKQEISPIFCVDHLSKPRCFYLKLNKEQHIFFSLCGPMESVSSVSKVMIYPGSQENFLCWYSWEQTVQRKQKSLSWVIFRHGFICLISFVGVFFHRTPPGLSTTISKILLPAFSKVPTKSDNLPFSISDSVPGSLSCEHCSCFVWSLLWVVASLSSPHRAFQGPLSVNATFPHIIRHSKT